MAVKVARSVAVKKSRAFITSFTTASIKALTLFHRTRLAGYYMPITGLLNTLVTFTLCSASYQGGAFYSTVVIYGMFAVDSISKRGGYEFRIK